MFRVDLNFQYRDGATVVPVRGPLDRANTEEAFSRLNEWAKNFVSVCQLLARDYGNDHELRLVFDVFGEQGTTTLDEHVFFNAVAPIPGIAMELAKYLRQITKLRRHASGISGVCYGCWYDEETPAGELAARILVTCGAEYIDHYIDFLRTNDLNVEVHQHAIIEEIIVRYGWCPETLKLAGVRASDCCGQHGDEQIGIFFEEHGLGQVLHNPQHFLQYFRPILAYFCTDERVARDEDLMRYLLRGAFPDQVLQDVALRQLAAVGLLKE